MMDLSLTSPASTKARNATTTTARHHLHASAQVHASPAVPDYGSSGDTTSRTIDVDLLLMNPTLRRQFVFYTTAANVTNFETMTRSSFVKFVRDCELQALVTPALTEADLVTIFAKACGTSKLMSFKQWIAATHLLLQRAFPDHVRQTLCETDPALASAT